MGQAAGEVGVRVHLDGVGRRFVGRALCAGGVRFEVVLGGARCCCLFWKFWQVLIVSRCGTAPVPLWDQLWSRCGTRRGVGWSLCGTTESRCGTTERVGWSHWETSGDGHPVAGPKLLRAGVGGGRAVADDPAGVLQALEFAGDGGPAKPGHAGQPGQRRGELLRRGEGLVVDDDQQRQQDQPGRGGQVRGDDGAFDPPAWGGAAGKRVLTDWPPRSTRS